MSLRYLFRFVLGVALTLSVAGFARAQCAYPPCDPDNPLVSLGSPPSESGGYGKGKAIGIGVGVAAAVVGITLYVRHKRSMKNKAAPFQASVVGCTQLANDGATLLLDEKEKKVYSLVAAGMDLKSGERVELTGNKAVDSSGKRIFTVQTLTRNLGFCGAETALNIAPAAQQ